jgi:hypothetical protein
MFSLSLSPLKKLNAPQRLCVRERKRMVYYRIISESRTTLINGSSIAYKTKIGKQRWLNYCHYPSLAPLGWLQAIDRGIHDDRDSEAWHIRVQKVSS